MGNVTVLDPTAGPASEKGELVPRLRSLTGNVGVLLDISKPRPIKPPPDLWSHTTFGRALLKVAS